MFFKIIKELFLYIFGSIKMLLLKIFYLKSFSYHLSDRFFPSSSINILRGLVKIGKKCKVEANTAISAVDGSILLGNGCAIGRNCRIAAHESIKIGNDVMIGPNVVILDHDHKIENGLIKKKEYATAKIVIEDGVWIGANCILLKGVTIGRGAVVAAGTVVTHDCPAGSLMIQKKNTELIKMKK